jgi:hypothetical protein
MATLTVYLDAVAVQGPGLSDWAAASAILSGMQPYVPQRTVVTAPAALAPAERRRVGQLVKLALNVASEAAQASGHGAETLASVFASSGGDGDNCHNLCEALAGDRLVSPTRFTNSVHNAPSGYWGILAQARAPSTTLCAYDASFAAGLLEATVQVNATQAPVLLVSYESPYPEPLLQARPVPDAFGVALVLSPVQGPRSLASLSLSIGDAPVSRLADAALEAVRTAIPAARSLPLLQWLARQAASGHGEQAGDTATLHLEYLHGRSLAVEARPC